LFTTQSLKTCALLQYIALSIYYIILLALAGPTTANANCTTGDIRLADGLGTNQNFSMTIRISLGHVVESVLLSKGRKATL